MLTLSDKLKNLPDKPGVYIMKDENEEIIYVGKAKNLKNRVKQYFQSSKAHSPKVSAMIERVNDLEYIITDSEIEALILECNLIKKHKPRYNILLKDDKQYPYIKITVNEDYPRIIKTREVKKDGARYFGPYTDGTAVYRTQELIKKIFPIRSCSKSISNTKIKERPCLNYHINRCLAPCQGDVNKEEYRDMINSICMLLDGKQEELIKQLEQKMHNAAENLDFERAAELRDNIESVKKIGEKQKIVSSSMVDQDVIAYAMDNGYVCIQIFFIRAGKLLGREHFMLEATEYDDENEILSSFIKQFYNEAVFIPKEILLQEAVEELEIIEEWLSKNKGAKVKITIPVRGEKNKLIEMVKKNAEDTIKLYIEKQKNDEVKTIGACRELAGFLDMEYAPKRIEAYDISHLQGVENVGSMVVFENGKAKNKDYRRFKIKYVEGANDYESMKEIVSRRFAHGIKEREALDKDKKEHDTGKFSVLPDLVMIDGGIGQVNAVLEIMRNIDMKIPVCGIVKDDKHRTRGIIYNEKEITIPINSGVFRLITNIQDEAHRFAISYHRSLRAKTAVKSALDDIPGIGPARRKALLKHFGAIKNIKNATVEELIEAPGMNKKIADIVYNFFRV